jgi:hypothetical protein
MKGRKKKESRLLEAICRCDLIVDDAADHEPPIGVGGGSFFFDVPHMSLHLPEIPTDLGTYQRYDFLNNANRPKNYTAIERVAIMTEDDSRGHISFVIHSFEEAQQVKLRLWLNNRKAVPTGQPDIIIDGTNGGSISTKQHLTTRQDLPAKAMRGKRHIHPGSDFCVVKWQIVDRGGVQLGTAEKDDLYYFYVSFHH